MTGEWIEHDGSEWPKHAKPEDWVFVRLGDGYETRDSYTVRFWHGKNGPRGSNWYWLPDIAFDESKIVAYRVVAK